MRGKSVRAVLLAMLVAVGALAGCGSESATATSFDSDPLTVDEVAKISRADVQAGIEDGSLIIVDTLPESIHVQQHLPGAVNIPGHPYETAYPNTDRLAPKLLPDKNAKMALYCINAPCRNSEFVGRRLMELGYTNVFKYSEGIQDWMQAGLPLEQGATSR